jgi:hypothetical protein
MFSLYSNADTYPFHSNTDPDPASNNNADPQPSFINLCLHLYFIAERQMFVTGGEERDWKLAQQNPDIETIGHVPGVEQASVV